MVIKTQPECAILREGSSLCLRIDAIGYPPPSYQWYKNDQELPGEILKELRVDRVSSATDGVYKCVVQNDENSLASSEVTVRVMKGENLRG